MTNYTETSAFASPVQIYDTGDPVLGGLTGQSNLPIEAILNRTRWLYDNFNFRSIAPVSATGNIDNTFKFALIEVTAANNITLTIAASSTFNIGDVLTFKVKTTAKTGGGVLIPKAVSIQRSFPDVFQNGDIAFTTLHLYDGETLVLVVGASGWEVLHKPTNIERAGEDALVRKMPRDAVVANGQAGNSRADYVRLWEAAVAIGNIVTESQWLSNPMRYKAYFSSGNTTSDFRFPDLRGLSPKALDLGRGISASRMDPTAGGYDADALLDHVHLTPIDPNSRDSTGVGFIVTGGGPNEPVAIDPYKSLGPINTYGTSLAATENKIKTWGKIPVIYF